MIKLKKIILDILKELELTPDDLKKFNKIMRNKIKIKNSIRSDDEPDYGREGFGYGGPISPIYKDGPDRTFVTRKNSVGSIKINTNQ